MTGFFLGQGFYRLAYLVMGRKASEYGLFIRFIQSLQQLWLPVSIGLWRKSMIQNGETL